MVYWLVHSHAKTMMLLFNHELIDSRCSSSMHSGFRYQEGCMWCTRQDYLLEGYNWQHAGPKRSRQRSSSSSRPTTIIGWWQGMRGRGHGPKPVCARRSCARMRCGGARLHSAPSPFASTSRMTSSCRCHVETGPLPVLICAYAEAYMSSELGYACAQGYKFFSSRHMPHLRKSTILHIHCLWCKIAAS